MQSFVICAVVYQNEREAVKFSASMGLTEILKKTLKAFNIPENEFNEYYLEIPSIKCQVKKYEHIRDDGVLNLSKNPHTTNPTTEKIYSSPIGSTSSKRKVKQTKYVREKSIVKESKEEEIDNQIISSTSLSPTRKETFNSQDDHFPLYKGSPITENEEEIQVTKESQENKNYSSKETDNPKDEKSEDFNPNQKENSIKICLNGIIEQDFANRTELRKKVKEWGSNLGFKLIFTTREQILKDNTKISLLHCNNKECEFYLEFITDSRVRNNYILANSSPTHNHPLEKKDTALEITEEIILRLKQLKLITKDNVKITKAINKEFNKNFNEGVIRYQLRKLTDEIYGKPTEDAQNLIKLMEEDVIKRSTFFSKKIEDNILSHVCFMTVRMKDIANKFNDVYIIDTSHRTNRFGLPLLDIVCVNNYGKTCTIFVALLKDSKYESFLWALTEFKTQLSSHPKIFFSDEEEALRKGIFYYCFYLFFSYVKSFSKNKMFNVRLAC